MNSISKLIYTLLILLLTTFAQAAVPHLINYQGKLTDKEGKSLEGTHSVTFLIYDSLNAGSLLWYESQSVLVQKGVFSVMLGSTKDLNLTFDKPYYLEIKVGNEVMTPRQRITSVGYAMRAKESDSLPNGVIIMCKDSCPAGYKRIGALDGKFLVGGTSYSTNAGGSNTHSHAAGSYKGPSHTHVVPATNTGWGSESGIHTWGRLGVGSAELTLGASNNLSTGAGGTESITGTSASTDSRPEFATVVLCEKE